MGHVLQPAEGQEPFAIGFRDILAEGDADYAAFKYREHGAFAVYVMFIGAALGGGLWLWDYALDPVGAEGTVWLRVAMAMCALAFPVASLARVDRRWLPLALYASLLVAECIFLRVQARLTDGYVYGIGGHMFFFIVSLLAGLPFSFRANVMGGLALASLPVFGSSLGFLGDYPVKMYSVLIFPAVFVVAAFLYVFERLQRFRYLDRREVERLATLDSMTGINNRRHFFRLCAQVFTSAGRYGRPVSVMVLDIDRFKTINDQFGHAVGDEAIRFLARTLRTMLRDADVVGRLGGDEFAVVLPETRGVTAAEAAERIRAAIERGSPRAEGAEGHVPAFTVSFGIAEVNASLQTLDAALHSADRALYEAKNRGRNQVVTAAAIGRPAPTSSAV